MRGTTDISEPEQWYPDARSIERTIIYHMGPTNSGKTKNALDSLSTATNGVYLAPLRLLAWEVADNLNERGVVCNLKTGQE